MVTQLDTFFDRPANAIPNIAALANEAAFGALPCEANNPIYCRITPHHAANHLIRAEIGFRSDSAIDAYCTICDRLDNHCFAFLVASGQRIMGCFDLDPLYNTDWTDDKRSLHCTPQMLFPTPATPYTFFVNRAICRSCWTT